MLKTSCGLLLVSCWLLLHGPLSAACAQVSGKPTQSADAQNGETARTETARKHFANGEAAYNQGDYRSAIAEWEQAYSADPRPRIQYNIYQAWERLGEFGNAAEALQRYLDTADRSDPFYDSAASRMADLQSRVPTTTLRFVGGEPGAIVEVDQAMVGNLPLGDLAVEPGPHRIRITLDGFAEFTQEVVAQTGRATQVMISQSTVPRPPLPAPLATSSGSPGTQPVQTARAADTTRDEPRYAPPPPRRTTRGERASKPFLLASAGLAGATLVTGIWALNRDAVLEGCDDPAFFCRRRDTVTTQRTVATVATATLGTGALGLFAYGVWLRLRGDTEPGSNWACGLRKNGVNCAVRF